MPGRSAFSSEHVYRVEAGQITEISIYEANQQEVDRLLAGEPASA